MVIHVHEGDWHTMAAEHREWVRAENRPRPGQRWSDRIGFATYRLKRDDNTIDWHYEDLPVLAEAASAAGIRDLVIEGWRETESPRNPAPRGELADPRMGGAPTLSAAISELAGKGFELAFAFHPSLINVFADRYPSPDALWAVKTSRQGYQIPVNFLSSTNDYPATLLGMRSLFLKGIGQSAFLSCLREHGVGT